MTRWEYAVFEIDSSMRPSTLSILNDHGLRGWEAYAVTTTADGRAVGHPPMFQYHMKRATQPEGEGT